MSGAAGKARAAAARAVADVIENGRSLTDALERSREMDALPARDRPLVAELSYGVLRWLPRLEALVEAMVAKRPRGRDTDVRALIMVGLYQLENTRVPAHAAVSETVSATRVLGKTWARGLVNASLRRFERESSGLLKQVDAQTAARLAHPDWLLEALRQAWPNEWEQIARANNERAPMHLRVNRLRVNRDTYLARLREVHIAASPLGLFEEGVTLARPAPVEALPGFDQGDVSVQDGAAQATAHLLDLGPGQRVLDACAAPGGKTAHILEREPGIAALVAVDADAARLARVNENLTRLRLAGTAQSASAQRPPSPELTLVAADAANPSAWWDGKEFDRILLDAPCTATGVIRRHPDIKCLRRPDDAAKLARIQSRLLDAMWPLLKDGGALLFATCSVLPQENDENVARFVERTDSAQAVPLGDDFGRELGHGRQILPGAQLGSGPVRIGEFAAPEYAAAHCRESGHGAGAGTRHCGVDGFYYALLRKG